MNPLVIFRPICWFWTAVDTYRHGSLWAYVSGHDYESDDGRVLRCARCGEVSV